ncbi:PilZ domain-containing protein [Desulfotalea psychrophila]|uniref:PilZ domain-containing protein n=1 Tax=Desulfotalea psychrophila (strain LSv54 / DSM 12343) TaxID=177439 RepID=Q6AQF0_DESPS|nr:PilZ domain-containing protein [Desulfotalea psychrophila]CAG35423.1 unknown protein [Desulfotalea psychrophila LSv54]
MPREQRSGKRFSLETAVKITYRHNQEPEQVETVSANISNGGAFLRTLQPLPLASKLQVEFLLDMENLKKLRFILSINSLKEFCQRPRVWVITTGVVIRQEADGIAMVFNNNYTVTPIQPGESSFFNQKR